MIVKTSIPEKGLSASADVDIENILEVIGEDAVKAMAVESLVIKIQAVGRRALNKEGGTAKDAAEAMEAYVPGGRRVPQKSATDEVLEMINGGMTVDEAADELVKRAEAKIAARAAKK